MAFLWRVPMMLWLIDMGIIIRLVSTVERCLSVDAHSFKAH